MAAPLIGTSWTLYRLSPLFHRDAPALVGSRAGLQHHARRLLHELRGDGLRGGIIAPSTAAGDETLARAGALLTCQWETLPTWRYWCERYAPDEEQARRRRQEQRIRRREQRVDEDSSEPDSNDDDNDDEDIPLAHALGIMITFQYEHAVYRAALLTGPAGYVPLEGDNNDSSGGITYLPLLASRLPNPLRLSLFAYLAATFDARMSILRLSSGFLCGVLESYLEVLRSRVGTRDDGGSSREVDALIEKTVRDTHLTISFPPPIAPALRVMDVFVSRAFVSAFAHSDVSARNGTRPDQNLTRNQNQDQARQSVSFAAALAAYLDRHLALQIDLTSSSSSSSSSTPRISKVSCGAFVLGAEGRIKFTHDPGHVGLLGGPPPPSLVPREEAVSGSTDNDDDGGGILGFEPGSGLGEARTVWRANEVLLHAVVARAVGRQQQKSTGKGKERDANTAMRDPF